MTRDGGEVFGFGDIDCYSQFPQSIDRGSGVSALPGYDQVGTQLQYLLHIQQVMAANNRQCLRLRRIVTVIDDTDHF